jgi:hypothetical protein
LASPQARDVAASVAYPAALCRVGCGVFHPAKNPSAYGGYPSRLPDALPAKQCLWRHKRANFPKQLAAQGLALGGQAPALVVGEPDPLASELLAEHAVLLSKVRNGVLLLLVHPPGQCNND